MLWDLEISNRNINWAYQVKQLLCNSGFREVSLQQNMEYQSIFINV